MDTAPYQEALEACCLLSDFAALVGGDAIEIGECGIKLLGDQGANISLARAIYARADIYLFDDTLSTVDAHVEKGDLYKAIMSKELLAGKAKLFVTHRIQYLAQSTTILLLCDGKVVRARQLPGAKAKTAEVYQLVTGHGSDSSNNTLSAPSALDEGIDDRISVPESTYKLFSCTFKEQDERAAALSETDDLAVFVRPFLLPLLQKPGEGVMKYIASKLTQALIYLRRIQHSTASKSHLKKDGQSVFSGISSSFLPSSPSSANR
ncbi:hypothetical protein BC939DRAFT_515572 [Gamsiella multidivaricata]|uniref:uncharacterized protein n=1 Tax=Gamsiella multidivaricata TaxID=101098 RepID=UPI00221EF9E2|nr:uncharacterized protein BC939DRAFT_515572 [Gamsiella multidivaricata]KAI7824644.1 hypothetical protein BC939DRAFT_515572 [Gamsiella multidivaricata]